MRLHSPVVLALVALLLVGALALAVRQSLYVFDPEAPGALLRTYVEEDAAQIQAWRLIFFAGYWALVAASALWLVRMLRANRAFAAKQRELGLEDDAAR